MGIGCHRGWTSGCEVQSGRRRPTGVEAERRGRLAGVLSHPSPGSTEHRHRLRRTEAGRSRRRGKTKASASRQSDQSHVVAASGPIFRSPPGVASASPAPPVPPSRHRPSPVATQDEGAALVDLSLTPIKNQPPRHPRHPPPPERPPNERSPAEPIPSTTSRRFPDSHFVLSPNLSCW